MYNEILVNRQVLIIVIGIESYRSWSQVEFDIHNQEKSLIKDKEVINYTIYCCEHFFFFLLLLLFRTFFFGSIQKVGIRNMQEPLDIHHYLPIKFVFFKKYIVSENTFLFQKILSFSILFYQITFSISMNELNEKKKQREK